MVEKLNSGMAKEGFNFFFLIIKFKLIFLI